MIVMDAGLASGKEIAKAGKKVVVLEARNRLGGRIHTLNVTGFSTHIEPGAELAQERMKQLYEQKGYSQKWIEKRVRGIAIRQELTDEWKQRGMIRI